MLRVVSVDGNVPLQYMIDTVQNHIFMMLKINVKIKPPENDKELQLLGKAFDSVQNYWNSKG
jgi:hypothetical protein